MKEYNIFCKVKEDLDIDLDNFEVKLMATNIVDACHKVEILFDTEDLNYEVIEVQDIEGMQ